jgi:hypothetical protein
LSPDGRAGADPTGGRPDTGVALRNSPEADCRTRCEAPGSGIILPMDAATALVVVKTVHTIVWAFFAACILAIPVAARAGRLRLAAVLSGIVLLEVAILAVNSMRCPLTDLAARFTESRSDDFDIYLPAWLARNNKRIFGALWVAGELVLLWCWRRRLVRATPAIERGPPLSS